MDIGLEAVAAVISAALAGVALIVGLQASRRADLRREDVLDWVNRAIDALQTQIVLCDAELEGVDMGGDVRMLDLRFRTSVLVEQGRMFFRNATPDDYGKDKAPAYRGYRPCILDPLVVAHQIAKAWPGATPEERHRMRIVADDGVRAFVSLAQKEVGRDRTASADTGAGGSGADLRHLMSRVDRGNIRRIT